MQQMDYYIPFAPSIGEAQVWAMGAALAFIVLDVVFGLTKAAHAGALSSSKMREGLWHKSAFVGVIALAAVIEVASGHLELGFDVPLIVPACCYIVLNEVMSIVESLAEINPELKGSKLLQLFESAKMDDKEADNG